MRTFFLEICHANQEFRHGTKKTAFQIKILAIFVLSFEEISPTFALETQTFFCLATGFWNVERNPFTAWLAKWCKIHKVFIPSHFMLLSFFTNISIHIQQLNLYSRNTLIHNASSINSDLTKYFLWSIYVLPFTGCIHSHLILVQQLRTFISIQPLCSITFTDYRITFRNQCCARNGAKFKKLSNYCA